MSMLLFAALMLAQSSQAAQAADKFALDLPVDETVTAPAEPAAPVAPVAAATPAAPVAGLTATIPASAPSASAPARLTGTAALAAGLASAPRTTSVPVDLALGPEDFARAREAAETAKAP